MTDAIQTTIEAVEFTKAAAAHIMISPQSALEQRLLSRLTLYLEQVLGKTPTIVGRIEAAPAALPAIVLQTGRSLAPGLPDSAAPMDSACPGTAHAPRSPGGGSFIPA